LKELCDSRPHHIKDIISFKVWRLVFILNLVISKELTSSKWINVSSKSKTRVYSYELASFGGKNGGRTLGKPCSTS
jgi:hypothetical protein